MFRGFAVAIALLLVGCSGGTTTPGGSILEFVIEPSSSFPTAPLATGDSTTISFHERTCHSVRDSHGQEMRTGCDPWHAPASIVATVRPESNGAPCPATVTVVDNTTIRATKTGAGNENFAAGSGWCIIDITDPSTQGASFIGV